MLNSILSGLRMFVFTPVMLLLAILGIVVCIFQDLLLYVLKLIWSLVRSKSKKVRTGQAAHLT